MKMVSYPTSENGFVSTQVQNGSRVSCDLRISPSLLFAHRTLRRSSQHEMCCFYTIYIYLDGLAFLNTSEVGGIMERPPPMMGLIDFVSPHVSSLFAGNSEMRLYRSGSQGRGLAIALCWACRSFVSRTGWAHWAFRQAPLFFGPSIGLLQ